MAVWLQLEAIEGHGVSMSEFIDKEFLVTGAAAGIGAAVARQLLEAGGRVWCLDLPGPIAAAIGELKAMGDAEALPVDVSDEADVERVLGTVRTATTGVLHGLVNSAAIGGAHPFESLTWSDWERELKVNVFGTYLTMRWCAPLLRASGAGRIVNIASNAGKVPGPASAPYNASKAAVINLTRSAAKALAPGIAVNSICPGHVDTALRSQFVEEASSIIGDVDFDAAAATAQLGRPARPDELADVVLFLLSSRSAFITGEDLNVNGGVCMF